MLLLYFFFGGGGGSGSIVAGNLCTAYSTIKFCSMAFY